jgi:hypothetical protein
MNHVLLGVPRPSLRRAIIFPDRIRRWLKRELGYVPLVEFQGPPRGNKLELLLRKRPLSVAEIAQALGVSEARARKRLNLNRHRFESFSGGALWRNRRGEA